MKQHEVPSLTLQVRALLIPFVERDPQFAVVEVDRAVQVPNLQEDLFDSDEAHGLPPR